MVSVVFAIWPSLTPERLPQGPGARSRERAAGPLAYASGVQRSKPRARIRGSSRFDIAWPLRARGDAYDVIEVPSLSEPDVAHLAVADGCRRGAEISLSGAAGRLR